jgi:phosphoribosylanthranilate isomerase
MGDVEVLDGSSRTFVKICGITNREDANWAIDCGADALGFIAVQESPRFVSAMAFHRIKDVMPENIPLVVVVKRPNDADKYDCDIVQFYEPLNSEISPVSGKKLIFASRIKDSDDVTSIPDNNPAIDAILLDAVHATVLGGSGTRFDWGLVTGLRQNAKKPFLLAGGLTPSNVAEALSQVRPFGVDVSSGVEDKIPGAKDHKLVAEFIKNVREWDELNREKIKAEIPTLFNLFSKS